VIPINNHEILSLEAGKLARLDQLLINQAQLDDDLMTFDDENGPATYPRSVILTQAQMHAAEHKGQIVTILKMHGHHLDLDKHDVWAYTRQKD
ncbi:MAG: DinB family, partial [Actinomycetota bacterium]